jgi:hypothetical protein
MGNQMFQYAWARILAERLGYTLEANPIEGFAATFELRPGKSLIGRWIRLRKEVCHPFAKAEFTARKRRPFLVRRSNLENYQILAPYRDRIRAWYTFEERSMEGMEFRQWHGEWRASCFERIEPGDLVVNVRLGDYLRARLQDRLLLYDYFRIILEQRPAERILITSDTIEHPWLLEFASPQTHYLFAKDRWETFSVLKRASAIAISQSTYSWWGGFLSDASDVYFPIAKTGVWTRARIEEGKHDLRVPEARYHYVDYERRTIYPTMADAFPNSVE